MVNQYTCNRLTVSFRCGDVLAMRVPAIRVVQRIPTAQTFGFLFGLYVLRLCARRMLRRGCCTKQNRSNNEDCWGLVHGEIIKRLRVVDVNRRYHNQS